MTLSLPKTENSSPKYVTLAILTFFRWSSESYSTTGCDDDDGAAVGKAGDNDAAVGTSAMDDMIWVRSTVDDPDEDVVVCRCRFVADADNNALRGESINVGWLGWAAGAANRGGCVVDGVEGGGVNSK